jgi:hypothetical protein
VGLLARGEPEDVRRANVLLHNLLHAQDTDASFVQGYGTFKNVLAQPFPSGEGALWDSKAYESYGGCVPNPANIDSNNALFVALAIVMVEALFSDRIEPELRERLKAALHAACVGNAPREIGYFGDNMCAAYSNPWMLRAVCTAFAAEWVGDAELAARAEGWARETEAAFSRFGTPGEFNSPTYAGVTMMALGAAQYVPHSTIGRIAPGILRELWASLAEVYNPTLGEIAGPWDRTYGYSLSQYYATVGATIAPVTGLQAAPFPQPLIGAEHGSDVALLPLQMLVAPYVEAALTREDRAKFTALTPHTYAPKAFSPPHDLSPRQYSFYVGQGLNIGGVSFDEEHLGGPALNVGQFVPGAIQWDSGLHGGGCGWIAVYPESACAAITATADALTVKLPKPTDFPNSPSADRVTLHIGALPFMQLNKRSFEGHRASLPGLDVRLSGNIVEQGTQTLEFNKDTTMHGAPYYRLSYAFPASLREEEPTLVVGVTRTKPPVYDLRF